MYSHLAVLVGGVGEGATLRSPSLLSRFLDPPLDDPHLIMKLFLSQLMNDIKR